MPRLIDDVVKYMTLWNAQGFSFTFKLYDKYRFQREESAEIALAHLNDDRYMFDSEDGYELAGYEYARKYIAEREGVYGD